MSPQLEDDEEKIDPKMKRERERREEKRAKEICTNGITRAMKIVIQICSFLRAKSRDNLLKEAFCYGSTFLSVRKFLSSLDYYV